MCNRKSPSRTAPIVSRAARAIGLSLVQDGHRPPRLVGELVARVDAEDVIDRREHVLGPERALGRAPRPCGRSRRPPGPSSGRRRPARPKAPGPVVAAGVAVDPRRAAELAPDQRRAPGRPGRGRAGPRPARRWRASSGGSFLRQFVEDLRVVVPAAVVDRDERHARLDQPAGQQAALADAGPAVAVAEPRVLAGRGRTPGGRRGR